jgi:regulator of cell morphogenesis and NO signaling
MRSLERGPEGSVAVATERDWQTEPLEDLVRYIVERHHVFTRGEINRLSLLLKELIPLHGRSHPELLRMQTAMEVLSAELVEHMSKEEGLLFPYISELEQADRFSRRPPEPVFGTIQNPIAAMIMEHEASEQALERLRETTQNYAIPKDACASFKALYEAFPAFAADLKQHIHLENDILFPRAIELEGKLADCSRQAGQVR